MLFQGSYKGNSMHLKVTQSNSRVYWKIQDNSNAYRIYQSLTVQIRLLQNLLTLRELKKCIRKCQKNTKDYLKTDRLKGRWIHSFLVPF